LFGTGAASDGGTAATVLVGGSGEAVGAGSARLRAGAIIRIAPKRTTPPNMVASIHFFAARLSDISTV
jgi:hypothetical protein